MEPIGQRFSQTYLRRTDLLPDSERMRIRLASVFYHYSGGDLDEIISRRLGIRPGLLQYEYQWSKFIEGAALRDVLDMVTICYGNIQHSIASTTQRNRAAFVNEVAAIFHEEQVSYRVDERAGVHFTVDQAFEDQRVSTILALEEKRYKGVKHLFEDAYAALDKHPTDGKQALRSSFFAMEGLFRLIFPSAHQLSAAEVQKHLEPFLNQHFANQKPAINLAQKLGFKPIDRIDLA